MREANRNSVVSVWTTEEGKKALELYQKDELSLEAVFKVLNAGKVSMEQELESVEEDTLRFRGMMLAYKKAYKEVLDEQSEKWYQMWEEMSKGLPSFSKDVARFKDTFGVVSKDLLDIKAEMTRVTEQFKNVNKYELEKMVGLVTAINNAPQETKDILKVLLK